MKSVYRFISILDLHRLLLQLKTSRIISDNDIYVMLIDRKLLSSIYPVMNPSFLLLQLCLIKVNHLFTLSYFHLFQIDVM